MEDRKCRCLLPNGFKDSRPSVDLAEAISVIKPFACNDGAKWDEDQKTNFLEVHGELAARRLKKRKRRIVRAFVIVNPFIFIYYFEAQPMTA